MAASAQQPDPEQLQHFLDRAVGDLAASYGGVMVSLGHRLGLYQAMANAGPLSPQQLARRAGCAERYVREWLNSQAAAGYVLYHPVSQSYELTPEQALVLADEDSPFFMAPAWNVAASMWLDEEKTLHAFKTGSGVGWGDHHDRLYCGVSAFYRNYYQAHLVSQWLPALAGIEERLHAGANVADIGCGHGHSTLQMATAFPKSRFYGFDSHAGSIQAAQRHAERQGRAEQVRFEVAHAQAYPKTGFDLICFFDCLHDMGDPLGAAKYAAEALAPGGTVMLVEPYANDRVEDNLNTVGRLFYAASTTICCAHSLSEDVGLALGAQAGEARWAGIFREAGFNSLRRAAETPFNLILEAKV
ncbi:class I SAM-dependent methyltransferase [Methylomonas sp. MO1]|uniref:class I SAM-dependent methyltransferase n=1 Tax=Methylomonas sp. MO1 TaxID=3073619 RepID=UPI0028A3643E|nr:class I SAM-dependent methyltransferase [Methylomonas sp. MO1]MDT4289147.1 class I SAM-dependent methyltransferase [Methylomonas sp. MO1]